MARYHFNYNIEEVQSCSKTDCNWGFHSASKDECVQRWLQRMQEASAKSEAKLLAEGFTTIPPSQDQMIASLFR